MSIYQFTAITNNGEEKSLRDYEGTVLLIVNTASKCGFTPQYKGLQELYEKYKNQGFEVLAFPCNQFGSQEPGTNEEIQGFCELNYGVNFPLFAKVDVKGSDIHPLFKFLTKEASGFMTDSIKWNFTKFLIDRSGNVVDRYAPTTSPESIEAEIKKLLG
jgi:glutathione peroxidase